MKIILGLCIAVLLGAAVFFWQYTQRSQTFGEFSNAPLGKVEDVLAAPERFAKQTVRIEGLIAKQCESMGCFFYFRAGTKELRVDLADIAMHAPKGKDGHRAVVEGRTVPYERGYQFSASAVRFY